MGGQGGHVPSQVLGYQLTLFGLRGGILCPPYYYWPPHLFSDDTASLQYCKFFMPRPLKRGKLGASTIIQSKDIDKYAFMCGLNFYESDVMIFLKYMLVPRSAGPSKRASINKTELNKKLAVGEICLHLYSVL